jgi:hypothetical protein
MLTELPTYWSPHVFPWRLVQLAACGLTQRVVGGPPGPVETAPQEVYTLRSVLLDRYVLNLLAVLRIKLRNSILFVFQKER